jgi:hypothetical protein
MTHVAALFGAGDVIAQKLIERHDLDGRRTARLVFFGGVFAACTRSACQLV